jgi:DNA-binding NtrC family response regulator
VAFVPTIGSHAHEHGEARVTSVLIVDDESRIRMLLGRWLAPDYQTNEAPDAETALGMIAESVPDIVLCDLQMPGHGGLWLMERIREQFPRVGIVLSTAAHVDAAPPAVGAGDIEYLQKPFERAQVLAAIGRAVEWRDAGR